MSLPPQQFCVRWNSYHTNLQTVFPKLLSTENFVDVTLACENRQIKCHKVVLSACSTYFERLLIQNPCKHPIIFMKDMRFSEMQSLVDFMYKGEVNVSQDDLSSLLKSAEALQIRGLCGSDSGGASSAGDNSQETNDSRSTSSLTRETSPQQPSELHKDVPKPLKIIEQPNQNCVSHDITPNSTPAPLSNSSKKRRDQGTSPELLSECRGTRKSGDLSFKEEMVEEDGLFYGEMENEDGDCGDQVS
ncbi:uncharacterized protein LOC143909560 [Arctopsyche grandis]|uniref:uncharacterized protein LOC143909560 n=1 Tax=Arctopsyche grandis TaxID=121162 RepID=UPI00406D960D